MSIISLILNLRHGFGNFPISEFRNLRSHELQKQTENIEFLNLSIFHSGVFQIGSQDFFHIKIIIRVTQFLDSLFMNFM